jgi:hypothetical protein
MNLNELSKSVHTANAKWWQDVNSGQPIKRNKGELLALIHSEISEALEGERKDLMDDKLPHRKMAEVELVDAIIRILDYAATTFRARSMKRWHTMLNAMTTNTKLAASLEANNSDEKQNHKSEMLPRLLPEVQRLDVL